MLPSCERSQIEEIRGLVLYLFIRVLAPEQNFLPFITSAAMALFSSVPRSDGSVCRGVW